MKYIENKFFGFFVVFSFLIIYGCSSEKTQVVDNEAKSMYLKEAQKLSRKEDSLKIMVQKYTDEKNNVALMMFYRQLGKTQRENTRFSDAITSHQTGLEIALKLNDTLEIVQALNDLSTDFRRISAMTEAANYSYDALHYIEAFSDVKNSGRKLRVMTLNGIGNISERLGYSDDAERYFREALKEETALDSKVGQAINYANLGSIFRNRQEYDSARTYYNLSLQKNIEANSKLGIGLCHNHLGNLYAVEKKYDLAEKEYRIAYDLMEKHSDKWHWLNACIALAKINLTTGKTEQYHEYISLAEKTAQEINSMGHLAEIYLLKHDYSIKQGKYEAALEQYKFSKSMTDSILGVKNTNHFMDLRVNYEREQNSRQLKMIEAENQIKEERRERVLYLMWLAAVVGAIIIGLLYYAYRQRTRSNQILKQIEQTRSDFFTNLTHEFRTPLTVIQGLNRQLQQRKDLSEKEKTRFMLAIDRQSENLLKLVNQLLDISKLKSGTDNPKWERGDIISYLRMTAETFGLFAQERNVNLVFYTDIAAQEMDFVSFYMDKIISNLLSNAIKHTENGDKIEFIVLKGKNPNEIMIRVADNGDGIPKDELDRIFELFYQSPNVKNNSGTGIGLAFTKMLVEKMKGKIEVESELGKGSTFTVTLPLKNKKMQNLPMLVLPKADHIVTNTSQNQDNHDDDHGSDKITPMGTDVPIVLVVEDSKDVSLFVKSLLQSNYNVITAKNGAEGLLMAEKYIPDIVITDVMMPVKNGYEFCTDMKDNVLLNHIPIIMLTAKTSEEDQLEGLRHGVDAYMRKPFRSEELLIRIEKILENRKILKDKYLSVIESSGNNISEQKADNDEKMKFLCKVMDIINAEITNPNFNATFIADRMAMSTSQLSRKLNQIVGVSTVSYILQVKLIKAKKMLQDSSISLGEVSDACGFYDLSYFSRTFKKEFGITPSAYQKNASMKGFLNT